MQVETLDSRRLTTDEALAIARLIVKVWPKPDKNEAFRQYQMLSMGQGYQGPDNQAPRSLVIWEQDRVIAHAAVIPRIIGTSHGDLAIAGLCKVCSDPMLRGKGLGELVVRGVFNLVDAEVFDFSLFQTTAAVKKFYEHLGACTVHNQFVNSLAVNQRENPFWDEIIMRYPDNRDWPSGEVDLRGPAY